MPTCVCVCVQRYSVAGSWDVNSRTGGGAEHTGPDTPLMRRVYSPTKLGACGWLNITAPPCSNTFVSLYRASSMFIGNLNQKQRPVILSTGPVFWLGRTVPGCNTTTYPHKSSCPQGTVSVENGCLLRFMIWTMVPFLVCIAFVPDMSSS